jgi:hypothetical protein
MMTERANSNIQVDDDPWGPQPARRSGSSDMNVIELDQAVRHLQDLARGRLAAPPQHRRRRRGKSRS